MTDPDGNGMTSTELPPNLRTARTESARRSNRLKRSGLLSDESAIIRQDLAGCMITCKITARNIGQYLQSLRSFERFR